MAVEKVARVLIAVHEGSRDSFIAELQRQQLLHVVRTEQHEKAAIDSNPDRTLSRLVEAIELLGPREKKGGLLAGMGGSKPVLTRQEFDQTSATYNPAGELDRLSQLTRELGELESRQKTLGAELRRLRPWEKLRYDPQELYSPGAVTTVLGRFPDVESYGRARDALAQRPVYFELVSETGEGVLAVVVSAAAAADETTALLATQRFEPADLRNVKGRPKEVIAAAEEGLAAIERCRAESHKEIDGMVPELTKLKVAADALAGRELRAATESALPRTNTVSLIHGWARERDLPKIEKLVAGTGVAAMTRVEPGPGEEQPVALSNPRLFRPFEMVLELFSLPSPNELDPTILIAPFFMASFALCLTDAGYGLVASIVTYFLLRKMGASNKLLGIILWGSIATIPAGALVGGWFGDIPDRLGIPWLLTFKNSLMWFDPVKDPMKFFVLSLGFGYVHMMYGMVIEIVDCIRVRDYGGAFLGQLPWFVSLNALTAVVLLGKVLPPWAKVALLASILVSVAAIIVFTQRARETMANQWQWFGLVSFALLFFGARLRWLPPAFLYAKWLFLAFTAGMMALAIVALVRGRKLKPVPVVFGVLAVAALGLYFARVIPGALASVVAILFLFTMPASKASLAKLAWGGYALYGATGFVGIVLSYIRLMALGMVTGGIAVTVNVIAWMVLGIPVVGIVMALIILVFGHAYNIAVNILGAFVHSLRLNYVEFFPRFYSGGSGPFVPFREEYQYTVVK